MIYFFTDFGYNGPYVGQMKSVVLSAAPACPVIDLMHDAPAFNPRASAILLSALSDYMSEKSITVAVVDPGVGNPARRPVMLQADDRWFIGPDNGLFQHIVHKSPVVTCYELAVGHDIAKSFHGRDVFAPAAGQLANNRLPDAEKIDIATLVMSEDMADVFEVIYIDHYGNAMTGIGGKTIRQNQFIILDGKPIGFAETFSSVGAGVSFWYVNSIGLVEISINRGSAAMQHQLFIGKTVEVN